MSTRCMVEVRGGQNDDIELLYHHSDGYPSSMVPLIQQAFRKYATPAGAKTAYGTGKYSPTNIWRATRANYAASMIASIEPAYYALVDARQVKDGHGQQGDLEYYYIVRVGGKGDDEEHPVWTIEIRRNEWNGELLQAPTPILRSSKSDNLHGITGSDESDLKRE